MSWEESGTFSLPIPNRALFGVDTLWASPPSALAVVWLAQGPASVKQTIQLWALARLLAQGKAALGSIGGAWLH